MTPGFTWKCGHDGLGSRKKSCPQKLHVKPLCNHIFINESRVLDIILFFFARCLDKWGLHFLKHPNDDDSRLGAGRVRSAFELTIASCNNPMFLHDYGVVAVSLINGI